MVTRLINKVMYDGKRGVSQRVCYGAFEMVADKTGKPALEVFQAALDNIMPVVETKSRRVGGSNYQVPYEVRHARRLSLGLRWLVDFARARNEKTMTERLAGEIMDAANSTGAAVKRRDDVHRMAEANKAFANYRI